VAIIAAQHTSENANCTGGEFVEDTAALGDTDEASVNGIAYPDGAIGIETDAIRYHVRLRQENRTMDTCLRRQ
jgi:hypothetical protein